MRIRARYFPPPCRLSERLSAVGCELRSHGIKFIWRAAADPNRLVIVSNKDRQDFRQIHKMRPSQLKSARPFNLFDSLRECGLPSDTHMHRRRHFPGSYYRTAACILFVATLGCVFSQQAYALPRHDNHAIHKVIEALEMEWRQAIIANDVGQMDHLLADDYIGISANGTVETKAQALAQRKAGTVKISQLDLTDLKVRVYGDTAVVTSQANLEGTNGQSNISGNYRYTRVYNRRLGQWKIVSFEASRMHDVDARPGKK
jgi:ketosteroid isomerase-like protein